MKNVESPPRKGDRPPFDLDSAAYDGPELSVLKRNESGARIYLKEK